MCPPRFAFTQSHPYGIPTSNALTNVIGVGPGDATPGCMVTLIVPFTRVAVELVTIMVPLVSAFDPPHVFVPPTNVVVVTDRCTPVPML